MARALPGDDRHRGRRAWGEFVPFLEFPVELRKIVYTTNAIESLNARFRRGGPPSRALPQRASRAEGPLPRRHASGDRTGEPRPAGSTAGRHILNALTVHYGDRISRQLTNDHHDRLHRKSDSPRSSTRRNPRRSPTASAAAAVGHTGGEHRLRPVQSALVQADQPQSRNGFEVFYQVFCSPRPRSSGDRASASGAVCGGSNPPEGASEGRCPIGGDRATRSCRSWCGRRSASRSCRAPGTGRAGSSALRRAASRRAGSSPRP